MAHLSMPKPTDPSLPVFFNVDGVVGAAPASNHQEDVLLVQFFLNWLGTNPHPMAPARRTAIYRAVRATGIIDAETLAAIREQQEPAKEQNPNVIVDGRVSPAMGSGLYGGGYFSIFLLNNWVQDRNLGVWPRIDLIPGFPAGLRAMVTRTLIGLGADTTP